MAKANDSTSPKISIIVPVYKVEQYLRRCLDSIASQTFTDWECILIDDGSPDKSGVICDEYAKRDSRFRVIHQENKGVSAARNAGLDAAQGEWIGFVDSDDWVERDCYETALYLADENNADLVQWNMQAFSDKENLEKGRCRKSQKFSFKTSCTYFEPSMCTKLVKASFVHNNKIRFPENIALSEDRLFALQVYLAVDNCYYTDKVFYHYYMRSTSASHTMTKEMILQEAEVVRQMENVCKNCNAGLDDFIYEQKKQVKLHSIAGLEKIDFDFCKSLFPEIDKQILYEKSKFSFLYVFVILHLHLVARGIVFIWKLFSGKAEVTEK